MGNCGKLFEAGALDFKLSWLLAEKKGSKKSRELRKFERNGVIIGLELRI